MDFAEEENVLVTDHFPWDQPSAVAELDLPQEESGTQELQPVDLADSAVSALDAAQDETEAQPDETVLDAISIVGDPQAQVADKPQAEAAGEETDIAAPQSLAEDPQADADVALPAVSDEEVYHILPWRGDDDGYLGPPIKVIDPIVIIDPTIDDPAPCPIFHGDDWEGPYEPYLPIHPGDGEVHILPWDDGEGFIYCRPIVICKLLPSDDLLA